MREAKASTFDLLLVLLLGGVGIILSYHCAYKMHGMIWITIKIVFQTLFLGVVLMTLTRSSSWAEALVTTSIIGIFVYYYILSWRLRGINKYIRLHQQLQVALELRPWLEKIQNVTEQEELDRLLNEAMQSWPKQQVLLKEEHQRRKEMLQQKHKEVPQTQSA
jgi:hypothetical protein